MLQCSQHLLHLLRYRFITIHSLSTLWSQLMTLHSSATLQRLRSRSTPLISLLGPQSRTSPFAIPTLKTRLGSRYLSGFSGPKFWPPPLMVLVLSHRRRATYYSWTHMALLFVDYTRRS